MPDPLKIKIRMIHVPFNYEHPNRSVSCISKPGVIEVDRTIGEAAIKAGAAQPFEPVKRAPVKRKSYRKPSTTKTTSVKKADDATDTKKSDDVDREDLAADGGTDGVDAVDTDTE